MTMNSPSDPWRDIAQPERIDSVNAHRVSGSRRWSLFWGVNTEQNCLLMFRFQRGTEVPQGLPRLHGLTVEHHSPAADTDDVLTIRLLKGEHREIFHRLCVDIVGALGDARTEAEAVSRFVARTWRWHRLLRGGTDGRLNEEQQRGLLAELILLDTYLLPTLGVSQAVRSWNGPLGAPKDFEIGRICVEVKARRGSSSPHVVVSSEHQLDSAGVDVLFLHVAEIVAAVDDTTDALTITEAADRIRTTISAADPVAADLFDARLFAVGFDWADDYSQWRWSRGPEHFFDVRDGFPRITSSALPSGVLKVRYSIALPDCEPFRVNPDDLLKLIRKR